MGTASATSGFVPTGPAAELLRSDHFSGVVRFVVDGELVFEHAAGLADSDATRPITARTRFVCASVTKMFTAVCIGRLIDAGFCSFATRLVEAVPRLVGVFDGAITVGDLLAHRSGLGDYIDDDAELPFEGFDVAGLDRPSAFEPLLRDVPRRPTTDFFYSSAGYILAGLLIEEVARCSYFDAITTHVCRPAGLTATDFPRMDETRADFAVCRLDDGSSAHPHVPVRGGPDGGIATTVADLERFFAALRGDALLSGAIRGALFEPVSRLNERSGYGRGFLSVSAAGRHWVGHSGGDPGVSARAMFDRNSDSSLVALCNRGSLAFRLFRETFDWPPE